MQKAKSLIKQVDLFSDLDDNSLELLVSQSRAVNFKKSAIIITEGETGESLYIIEHGSVRIYVSDEKGGEMTIFVQGPGSYIGEISLLDGAPRTASAIALEDTRVLMISKSTFARCISQNPQIAFHIIQSVTQRLRKATNDIRSLALENVYQRLAHKLLELSSEQDGLRLLPRKFSQQELATMIGASREMVGKLLADLSSGGYIDTVGPQMQIVKALPQDW
jgi:CRP/FNR family cyclic AMP-dependent transcriptional regulator